MRDPTCIVCKIRPIHSPANALCLMCLSEVHEKFQRRIKKHGPLGQEEEKPVKLLQALLLAQQGKQRRVVKEKV